MAGGLKQRSRRARVLITRLPTPLTISRTHGQEQTAWRSRQTALTKTLTTGTCQGGAPRAISKLAEESRPQNLRRRQLGGQVRPRAPVSMVAARNLEHSDLGAGLLLRTVPLITEQATRRFGVGGKLVNRTDGVVASELFSYGYIWNVYICVYQDEKLY